MKQIALKVLRKLPVIQTEIEDSAQSAAGEAEKITANVENSSCGLPIWAIIVIAVVLIVLVLVAVAVFFIFRKNKKTTKQTKTGAGASRTATGNKKLTESVSNLRVQKGSELQRKDGVESANASVPDRNAAIYPEIVLINLEKPDYIYRVRIIDKIIIGRKEGSDIRISTDPAVSSRHCIISIKGTQFYLEDCNSSNGTRYNDQEVNSQIPIMSGGILEIGHDKYRLIIGK